MAAQEQALQGRAGWAAGTAWVPDEEANACTACECTFTTVNRKHHCRHCGKIFCGGCSSHRLDAARVCNRCFDASDPDRRESDLTQDMGHPDSIVDATAELGANLQSLSEQAVSGLLPSAADLVAAPVMGAYDDGFKGLAKGLEAGGAGFAKSGLRTVGLATKAGMAFGKLTFHGASAVARSAFDAAEDAKITAGNELASTEPNSGLSGIATSAGVIAKAGGAAVGATAKNLAERTIDVTVKLTRDDNPVQSGALREQLPVRFRSAFDPRKQPGMRVAVLYENQRRPLRGGEFSASNLYSYVERGPWSDESGRASSRERSVDGPLLTAGWLWVGEWYVVYSDAHGDDEGWGYSFRFPPPGDQQQWQDANCNSFGNFTWVRRRRWERMMAPMAAAAADKQQPPPAVAAPSAPPAVAAAPAPLPAPSGGRASEPPIVALATHFSSPDQLQPEPEPEPEPESERHRFAVAVESTGKSLSEAVMRGAVGIGTAANSLASKHIANTAGGDTGPVSEDTKELIELSQEVSEDLLGATRVVASGVSSVFKFVGTNVVQAGEHVSKQWGKQPAQNANATSVSTAASDNSESAVAAASDDAAGSGGGTLDVLKDVGVAGIDAGVDLYYTLRRAGGVAAEGLTSAAVDVVEHKHGSEAGHAARQVGDSVTNLGHAVFNVYTVHGAGAVDLAVETVATAAGKDEWLAGPPLLVGRLELLPQGWATNASGSLAAAAGAVVAATDVLVELRRNSIALVSVANRRKRVVAAFSAATEGDGEEQVAAAIFAARTYFDIIIPLADITLTQLQKADGTAYEPSTGFRVPGFAAQPIADTAAAPATSVLERTASEVFLDGIENERRIDPTTVDVAGADGTQGVMRTLAEFRDVHGPGDGTALWEASGVAMGLDDGFTPLERALSRPQPVRSLSTISTSAEQDLDQQQQEGGLEHDEQAPGTIWMVCSGCAQPVAAPAGWAAGRTCTCLACGLELQIPATIVDLPETAPPHLLLRTMDDLELRLRSCTTPVEDGEGQEQHSDVRNSTCHEEWAVFITMAMNENAERRKATWVKDYRTGIVRPGARWVPDDEAKECRACKVSFSSFSALLTNRKHHCRNCGNIFCHTCSEQEREVPGCGAGLEGGKGVRVCDRCAVLLDREQMGDDGGEGAASPAIVVQRP